MDAQLPAGAAPGALVPAAASPAALARPGPGMSGLDGAAVPGWSLEVTAGPNAGAVVPLDGEARIGSGLDNDIVLADASVAERQAIVVLDGDLCLLDPLADGISVNGKPAPAGRFVQLRDGLLVQAGQTIIRVHGPAIKPRRAKWLVAAVPAVLAIVGVGALVGLASPGRNSVPPPPPPQVVPAPPPSADAAAALGERLRDAGLADVLRVTAGPGTVMVEGRVTAAQLQQWSTHQRWFDGRYSALSLDNRVREAAPDEKPNIQLRAVSLGAVPYFITAGGDRYVTGSVVDGWTVDAIESERILFSRGSRRAEIRL